MNNVVTELGVKTTNLNLSPVAVDALASARDIANHFEKGRTMLIDLYNKLRELSLTTENPKERERFEAMMGVVWTMLNKSVGLTIDPEQLRYIAAGIEQEDY